MDAGKILGFIASASVRHLVFHAHGVSGMQEMVYNATDMFVSEFARRHLETKIKKYIEFPHGNLAPVLISRSIGILAGIVATIPLGKVDYAVLVAANAASLFACFMIDIIEQPFCQVAQLAAKSSPSNEAAPLEQSPKSLIERYLAGRVMYT
ncbi:MAG: hypothetical protein JSS10_01000 [Verrucomicrobia bacterium]|nr:hypothetical protein [Verrucomicrobiota bacterium]